MPAFSGDLGPGDLEACDSLMGGQLRHAPQEAAGDVPLNDGERGRQVLRLSQNLRSARGCEEKRGLGHGLDI